MNNHDKDENPKRPRTASPKLTEIMAEKIKALKKRGFMQHDIAAMLEINQGRVSEVLTGKRFNKSQGDLFE